MPEYFKIVMRAGERHALRFQDAIKIDEIAFVCFDGFRTRLALMLEIFEERAKPMRKIGVEVHV
jgi:hypothetical protein